jgi:O-acetylserine/cysteine efflux transporter
MKRDDLLLTILVMAIWGFNFSMIKMSVSEIDPLLITAARFGLAITPAIFFIARPKVGWHFLISHGVVFGVGVWGMAAWSMASGLSSSLSSVMLSANVLLSMILGILILNERVSTRKCMGGIIALVALILLSYTTTGTATWKGMILIVIATCCRTLCGFILKASKTQEAFAFNVWSLLFAPIPLIAFSIVLNGHQIIEQAYDLWNWDTSIAVLFQAYPTTLFGYWVWNKMLIRYPLSTVAPLNLLVPVFAMLSGVLFYDESLTMNQVVVSVLFLLGIALIVKPKAKPLNRLSSIQKTQ